ncbi:MAG: hypothetical protein CM15mP128_5280 [Methanobacteriota archaeon]|nr:MAG: hypothetical protein CM15mP128_5280 [Euryarchaeota archaeon]
MADLADAGLEARVLQDRPEPGEVAALAPRYTSRGTRRTVPMGDVRSRQCSPLTPPASPPHLSRGICRCPSDAWTPWPKRAWDGLRRQRGRRRFRGRVGSACTSAQPAGSHDHFIQKLEMQTDLDLVAQNPLLDERLKRRLDQERFVAWCEGRTGWGLISRLHAPPSATGWDVVRDAGHDDGGRRLPPRFAVA